MKNFVADGNSHTMIAPAGGVVSGTPYVIGSLALVALDTADAGQPFVARLTGVASLPTTAGLGLGAKVSLKAGVMVADGTASSFPFGKLLSDESGGFAEVRISN